MATPAANIATVVIATTVHPKRELLFTVGIVGVGFLAIPTLAGSAAYAFAETLGWRQGLDKKLKKARAFYTLIFLSTAVGVGLDFVGINPVKALYRAERGTNRGLKKGSTIADPRRSRCSLLAPAGPHR